MILRSARHKLQELAKTFRCVAVTGPRQSGKTTLCRSVFPEKPYISLENPDVLDFALTDPRGFLSQFPEPNGAILDEIQKAPQLFSYLQQILDESTVKGLFVLTGSNNFLLQENISQSLSGRIAYLQLLPLSLMEMKAENLLKGRYADHIFQGAYPEIAVGKIAPTDWFPNYIRTYIERDVRQLKNISNLALFTRFLRLVAGRTGQILNMASLGNDCGIDQKTVAAWLGVLQSSFIVYLLKPFHSNFNKRIVKSPKLYFYDSGLVCSLLGIRSSEEITMHPAKGALFENLMLSELLKARLNVGAPDNLYFWRDKTGNEVDVIIEESNALTAIEIKAGETISRDYFKGLDYFAGLNTMKTDKILLYGGKEAQSRSNEIRIKPWHSAL
jgi:predicted AAA+ superfamily ATPase